MGWCLVGVRTNTLSLFVPTLADANPEGVRNTKTIATAKGSFIDRKRRPRMSHNGAIGVEEWRPC